MNTFLNVMNLNRRHCIAFAATLTATGNYAGAAMAQATSVRSGGTRILVLGDSLSAEYGLRRGTGWVALLEQQLAKEKIAATVVNASISGDTTSGGRARLTALLKQHRPQLVVIELGANDALRGLPLTMTQDNLAAMTKEVQKSGAKALSVGMQLPPNFGREYGQRFADVFAAVAKSHKAALVPFMLKGVADDADSQRWFQADRIHPREEAHPVILANIWPEINKGLR